MQGRSRGRGVFEVCRRLNRAQYVFMCKAGWGMGIGVLVPWIRSWWPRDVAWYFE